LTKNTILTFFAKSEKIDFKAFFYGTVLNQLNFEQKVLKKTVRRIGVIRSYVQKPQTIKINETSEKTMQLNGMRNANTSIVAL
jgi:hypothetical protein